MLPIIHLVDTIFLKVQIFFWQRHILFVIISVSFRMLGILEDIIFSTLLLMSILIAYQVTCWHWIQIDLLVTKPNLSKDDFTNSELIRVLL